MTLHVVSITGNKTLDGEHANMLLDVTAAAVVTVPKATTYDFTNSDKIRVARNTAGTVRFVAATGVSIRSKGGSLVISVQYGLAILEKISTDVWLLTGDI